MNLIPQDELEKTIAAHPDIDEERKRFLVEFLADAAPERIAQTLRYYPSEEAAFIRACVTPTAHAA